MPVVLAEPTGAALPLVYDSPHSGRDYPDDFGSRLERSQLRRAEDAYVDQLIAGAPAQGATLIHARFPRAYIDVNRAEDDIDPRLLADAWPTTLRPGAKSAMHIGLIREIVTPGVEIYDRKLHREEIEQRIERYWRPYRTLLAQTIASLRGRFGRVLHIQWHSMKSVGNAATPDGPGASRPDFVLGDRHGTTCAPEVLGLVANVLSERGCSVAINDPYAGGDVLAELADPSHGIECLQIEINRALYLDEASVTKTAGFADVESHVSELTRILTQHLRGRPTNGGSTR